MISAFLKDESSFKKKLLLLLAASLVLLGASYWLSSETQVLFAKHAGEAAQHELQKDWLEKFDLRKAREVYAKALRPCAFAEIGRVQSEQNAILEAHKLKIGDTRAIAATADKKAPAEFRSVTVEFSGSWDNLLSALEEFETKNLVAVTKLRIVPNREGSLSADMQYNIYHRPAPPDKADAKKANSKKGEAARK